MYLYRAKILSQVNISFEEVKKGGMVLGKKKSNKKKPTNKKDKNIVFEFLIADFLAYPFV